GDDDELAYPSAAARRRLRLAAARPAGLRDPGRVQLRGRDPAAPYLVLATRLRPVAAGERFLPGRGGEDPAAAATRRRRHGRLDAARDKTGPGSAAAADE